MVASCTFTRRAAPVLTGCRRYRSSFFGTLVLQVEESRARMTSSSPFDERPAGTEFGWRDATIFDLQEMAGEAS